MPWDLRALSRKTGFAFFLVLLLLAGIVALTQEFFFLPDEEQVEELVPIKPPARWFRSNSGGMILEEIPSRLAALRNKYALMIDIAYVWELPEAILPFYNEEFYTEIRVLHTDGKESRRQWIFRDQDGTTRLVAVFEPITEEEIPDEEEQQQPGFIEIYDENYLLTEEHQIHDNGLKTIIYFSYTNNAIIRAEAWRAVYEPSEATDTDSFLDEEEPVKLHTDYYFYNRSGFLRAVERVYHEERRTDTDNGRVRIAFPSQIKDAINQSGFITGRVSLDPDFFGGIVMEEGSRIEYDTDDRGRLLAQTMFSKDDEIIWVINYTWSNDRIIFSAKTEGDVELLTEYEYDDAGSRIIERNLRNGVLERTLSTEGSRDIEELYMNGAVVLRAIWENGRKVSEARIRDR